MSLFVLGLNHQTAPVSLRERVSFSGDGVTSALEALRGLPTAAKSMALADSWQQPKRVNRLNRMSIQGNSIKESAAAYESATQFFLNLARGVSKDQLDIKDPEGWSARQIIHHLADSEAPPTGIRLGT